MWFWVNHKAETSLFLSSITKQILKTKFLLDNVHFENLGRVCFIDEIGLEFEFGIAFRFGIYLKTTRRDKFNINLYYKLILTLFVFIVKKKGWEIERENYVVENEKLSDNVQKCHQNDSDWVIRVVAAMPLGQRFAPKPPGTPPPPQRFGSAVYFSGKEPSCGLSLKCERWCLKCERWGKNKTKNRGSGFVTKKNFYKYQTQYK